MTKKTRFFWANPCVTSKTGVTWRGWILATINFSAMTDSDDEDSDNLIPDGTDDPIVSHSVLPKLAKFFAG
jgi:hypothetical protein